MFTFDLTYKLRILLTELTYLYDAEDDPERIEYNECLLNALEQAIEYIEETQIGIKKEEQKLEKQIVKPETYSVAKYNWTKY